MGLLEAVEPRSRLPLFHFILPHMLRLHYRATMVSREGLTLQRPCILTVGLSMGSPVDVAELCFSSLLIALSLLHSGLQGQA